MFPIKLPVSWNTEDTQKQEDLGIDNIPVKDLDKREMLFFQITAISPYYDTDDNRKEYCTIHANGTTFICLMTMAELEAKLMNSNIKELIAN